MNEIKNENEYVTKKEFKKSVKNMNFLLCAVVLCVLYMYFFKQDLLKEKRKNKEKGKGDQNG